MAEFKKLINPPIKASEINSESATNGQVLTANGTGGATWQDASGGGGGFTPRFIYDIETVSASMFDITNKETYFECKVKTSAGDLDSVTFTANVQCYIMMSSNVTAFSIGKMMNAGESITQNLGFGAPSSLKVRVYPIAEYDNSHLTLGVLTLVEL